MIEIKWLSDEWECETCGPSWAEGALVWLDGEVILDLVPTAHCYDGDSWSERDVLEKIIEVLGHKVEYRYE